MLGLPDDMGCSVFALIKQFGGAAVHFAREQAEIANAAPNTISARAGCEIADAIEWLTPRQQPPRHPRGQLFSQ